MVGVAAAQQSSTPAEPDDEGRTGRQRRWGRVAGRLASAAVVAAIFGAIFPNLVDISATGAVLTSEVSTAELVGLALLTLASLVASFLALMAVLPGLDMVRAGLVNVTSTSVAYAVPGGGAAATGLSVAMLRSFGFGGAAIGRAILVGGWWNLAVKVGLPLLALGLLGVSGGARDEVRAAAVVALVILAGLVVLAIAAATGERPAIAVVRRALRVAAPVLRRAGWVPPADVGARVAAFRSDTGGLIRRRWMWLTGATLAYHLSLFGVLCMALAAVGALEDVGVLPALAVFAVVRQLTAVPVTPGGVGLVELGLVGGLHLAGAGLEDATAAVLLHRGFTYLLYLPAGIPTYVAWLRLRRHDPAPVAVEPAERANRTGWRPGWQPGWRPLERARLVVSVVALVGLWLAASGARPGRLEVDLFGLVNRLPDALMPVLWPVMQLGWIGAAVAWSTVTLVRRGPGRAVALLGAGTTAWVLAKVVKDVVGRGRPGALLEEVVLRGDAPVGGLGFVAGHTAVAAALVTVAAATARRRTRWVLWGLVALVGVGRVYTGAHLPLDVVAGAALGWGVGIAVRWLSGTPVRAPSPRAVTAAVGSLGIDVEGLVERRREPPGAATFVGRATDGRRIFVKAIGRDQWDAEVGHRLWRLLAFREAGDEAPFSTAKQQLEHEAYLLALARAAGARVPVVVSTVAAGADWLLVLEGVDGTPLAELPAERWDDELLGAVWRQVALLHRSGIAHRQLRPDHVLVDDDGRPWLVSLQWAEAGASPGTRAADTAELLVTAAAAVGPEVAVAAAVEGLGPAAVAEAVPLLQPLALTPPTRAALAKSPALLAEVAAAVAGTTGSPPALPQRLVRRPLHPPTLLVAALASAVVYQVVAGVSGVSQTVRALGGIEAGWLVATVAAVVLGYVSGAVALLASSGRPLALGRTVVAQLVGSAVSTTEWPRTGALLASASYLRAVGVDPARARGAALATGTAGAVIHTAAVAGVGVWLVVAMPRTGGPMQRWLPMVAFAAAMAVVGVVASAPLRRVLRGGVGSARRAFIGVVRGPGRATMLLGGAAGVTAMTTAAFLMSLAAVGGRVSVPGGVLLYLVVAALAPLAPFPGGIGLVEPALAGGLIALGVSPGQAASGVILFRLVTYWLPVGPAWLALRRLPLRTDDRDPASEAGEDDLDHDDGDVVAELAGAPVPATRYYRHPADAARAVTGIVLGLTVALFAGGGMLLPVEVDAFRLVNRLPSLLFAPVNAIMQAGWAGAVPLAAGVAVIARRRRLALDLLVAGLSAWLLAKVVKSLADRGRPGALLDEVVLRGASEGGLGFVSGHAAVAAAIATVASGHVRRPVRWALWAVAVGVGIGRVYVGAHFPLDVVAGAALGWAIGSLVHLARGTPGHLPAPTDVVGALRDLGMRPAGARWVAADARGSIPFEVTTAEGGRLFVKAMGRDQRDADLLFKLWRFVAYRETEDEAPFTTPKRQLEHEAYLTMLAASAGATVPKVVSTGGDEEGVTYLVLEHVDGTVLADLGADSIDDELLDRLWAQVALLHAAGIAHRDLRASNVLVDPDGQPWLVDFGFAEAGAGDDRLRRDVAELLASSALLVGAERAVGAAVRALGPTQAWEAAHFVQPFVLSRATRTAVRRRPALLWLLRSDLADAAGRPDPTPERVVRVGMPQPMTLSVMVVVAYGVYHTLVTATGVRDPLGIVGDGSLRWLGIAVLGVVVGHLTGAAKLIAAARHHLALGRTVVAVAAASLVARTSALGLEAPGYTALYLERSGLPRARARGAANLAVVAAMAGRVVGCAVALALAITGPASDEIADGPWELVAAGIAVGALFGVAPAVMRRAHLVEAMQSLPSPRELTHHVGMLVGLVLGAAGSTVAFMVSAVAVCRAVGVEQPAAVIAAVFLLAAGAAVLAPVPGGVGVAEVFAAFGLMVAGTPTGSAVVAAVVFRLVTFWLPLAPALWASRVLHVWVAPGATAERPATGEPQEG
ncbi:MAG TPA: phosphatase PAP2 family protein [Acidimicrobiales bacterium]|nr:phosphatase PAP2 family protein [Acidimicrobiales bacterium]